MLRKFLWLEVGAPGTVLVLAYLVLSEITLAVQNDRPAIKKRVVVAESLTLSSPKRAGTARLALGSGAELSLLQFASPDGVGNLKMLLVRGLPVIILWDAKRNFNLGMEANQKASSLLLNRVDNTKGRLGMSINCGKGTSWTIMRGQGGGVRVLVDEGLRAPSCFLHLAPAGLGSDNLSLYMDNEMTGLSVSDSAGKQRTSMRLVPENGFAGLGFYDRADSARLSLGVVRRGDPRILIHDRGGRALQSIP
jgi:hypothetical protein